MLKSCGERRRHDTIGEANPLTGLLYCADCGEKLYNHRSRGNPSKPYPSDGFNCSTYSLARQKHDKACSNHHISTKALRTLILETIRATSAYTSSNETEFIQKVRSASEVQQAQAAKELKRRLNKDNRRCTELDTIIKKLYESYAIGRIGEERFDTLLSEYERDQTLLRQSITEAESALNSFETDTANVEHFLSLAKKYTDFSELTTPMINEFIEKIIVHALDRSTGDRVQEVDIYLKYIGRSEALVQELTAEEVAEQERLQKERAHSREQYQRMKAGLVRKRPAEMVCQGCGTVFIPKTATAMFCCAACRQRTRRREAREAKS